MVDALQRLHAHPPERWWLVGQQKELAIPAFVEAAVQEAVTHRRTDRALSLAYAQAAAAAAGNLDARHGWLQARALAELANAHRIVEDYEKASELMQRAQRRLPADAPAEIRGEVLSLRASLLLRLSLYEQAAVVARAATEVFSRAALALKEAETLIKTGYGLSLAGDLGGAKESFEQALAVLQDEERIGPEIAALEGGEEQYLALVTAAQINALQAWVTEAEEETDPAARSQRVEESMQALRRMQRNAPGDLPAHERLQFDWMWGRLMVVDGKYGAAQGALQDVCEAFRREGLMVSAAHAGLDLLHAYVLGGALEKVNETAAALGRVFEQHGLSADLLAVYQLLATTRRRRAARSAILRAQGHSPDANPRRPVGIAG